MTKMQIHYFPFCLLLLPLYEVQSADICKIPQPQKQAYRLQTNFGDLSRTAIVCLAHLGNSRSSYGWTCYDSSTQLRVPNSRVFSPLPSEFAIRSRSPCITVRRCLVVLLYGVLWPLEVDEYAMLCLGIWNQFLYFMRFCGCWQLMGMRCSLQVFATSFSILCRPAAIGPLLKCSDLRKCLVGSPAGEHIALCR